jgi:hypothetical protein
MTSLKSVPSISDRTFSSSEETVDSTAEIIWPFIEYSDVSLFPLFEVDTGMCLFQSLLKFTRSSKCLATIS